MKLALGADHRGYQLKEYLKQADALAHLNIEWIDVGAFDSERSDYSVFSIEAAKIVQSNKASGAVLLCGTAVGMAIAANRFKSIYAAVVWQPEIARLAKEDDNANIIVLPADYVSQEQAVESIEQWLAATFKGGRYQQRIDLIDQLP